MSSHPRLAAILTDPVEFSRATVKAAPLRGYQAGPVRAAAAAVGRGGEQLAWVYSRQSGKDESLAQLLAYLLIRYQARGGSIVVAAPTLRPQAVITRDRLLLRLDANPLAAGYWTRDGVTVGMGQCRVTFMSAGPDANARGQTASLLLVANEAQDIDPDRWDAVFDPMAASTNATTLFMGTTWDDTGLLARQMKWLAHLEARDGGRRLFLSPWREAAAEVPAYGDRVRARIEQFGEDHPFIRTEYELEQLQGSTGLFDAERRERMAGGHRRRREPERGKVYALALDVAGEEEETRQPGKDWDPAAIRDATALTIFEVERGRGAGVQGLPVYRVADRRAWTGAGQVFLAGEIERIARGWGASALAVDATGIGEGLAAVLADRLDRGPRRCAVYPFRFTQRSKSDLGWGFLGLVDAGRYREYARDRDALTDEYWRQVERAVYEVRPGPGKLLSWGHRPGEHDDLLVSAALCWALDEHDWRSRVARGR